MFPLKKRKICGYKFKEKTFYSKHHLGVDYCADSNKLYAPFDGEIIKSFYGNQGGNTIWFRPYGRRDIIRFMHLNWGLEEGKYKEGDIIGKTGNTGNLTTTPHLHIDISRNKVQINNITNFLDPEEYNWVSNNMEKTLKAIKKYIYDYGKKINKSEDEKIAKKIKKLFEDKRDLLTELMNEKAKPRISFKSEWNDCMAFVKELKEKEKELDEKIKRQAKEITSLKAVNERNAKDSRIIDSLKFLIETIINR